MELSQEIINAVQEYTPAAQQGFVTRYLEATVEMGATLILDEPFVRIWAPDGREVGHVDLPLAETFVILPPENG